MGCRYNTALVKQYGQGAISAIYNSATSASGTISLNMQPVSAPPGRNSSLPLMPAAATVLPYYLFAVASCNVLDQFFLHCICACMLAPSCSSCFSQRPLMVMDPSGSHPTQRG